MGDIIQKAKGEEVGGGGDHSPFNYEVSCTHCQRNLGRLGTFHERLVSGRDQHLLKSLGLDMLVGSPIRILHCGACHATNIVHHGNEVAGKPPIDNRGQVCRICGRIVDPEAADARLARSDH